MSIGLSGKLISHTTGRRQSHKTTRRQPSHTIHPMNGFTEEWNWTHVRYSLYTGVVIGGTLGTINGGDNRVSLYVCYFYRSLCSDGANTSNIPLPQVMRETKKQKSSIIYTDVVLVLLGIFLVLAIIDGIWHVYNSFLIKHYGVDAIATVIGKDNSTLYYDVLYDGQYYLDDIRVSKRVYRKTIIGEHYPARVLPKKMHLHNYKSIPHHYIRITLCPMITDYQDVLKERCRIDSMYYHITIH